MATPPSKSDLLKHFANPLLSEIFEKRAEQIIREKKDPMQFINAAKDLSNRIKDFEGKEQEEFIIGIRKSLTAAINEPANKPKHYDDARLKELSQASSEEKDFGKKVAFIQSLIDQDKSITETQILRVSNTIPDLDANRVESFKIAADSIKTKPHPQPLMTKIFNAIGKYDCSSQKLLEMQALCDYVRIKNNSADGSKPFSESLVKTLKTKTQCLQQLAGVEKDLKTFDHFLKEMSERKKTFTKSAPEQESEPNPASPRRRTI